jgi:hypothetical protein
MCWMNVTITKKSMLKIWWMDYHYWLQTKNEFYFNSYLFKFVYFFSLNFTAVIDVSTILIVIINKIFSIIVKLMKLVLSIFFFRY